MMNLDMRLLINKKLLTISGDRFELGEFISGKSSFKTMEDIIGISATKDFVIFTKNYSRFVDNIDAYDWYGNHIWNIADIVGKTGIQYLGSIVTAADFLRGSFDFDESKYNKDNDLVSCSTPDIVYIIDLTTRKIIQVFSNK